MHLNYFVLRHFSQALHLLLKDCTFINAFSFSKEELVFSFLKPDHKELFVSVNFVNKSSYFRIQENYNRPKRNFLFQFEVANGGIVQYVEQIAFDRSFYIQLKTGYRLLFKLHGSFSNIILINTEGEAEEIFRKECINDASIKIENLQKHLDTDQLLSPDITAYPALKTLIPLLDNYCLEFLERMYFLTLDNSGKKELIKKYFLSNSVPLYLIKDSVKSHLLLFPDENAEKFNDPLEAYNELSHWVLPSWQSQQLKVQLMQQMQARLQKTEKQILRTAKHLENVSGYTENENIGHIIMANMHMIPRKVSQAELFDFYKNQTISVRLDKNLKAQENAEKYYRKSKAQKQELPALEKSLNEFKSEQLILQTLQNKLSTINDLKLLKLFAAEHSLLKQNQDEIVFPFRKMVVDGFDVWIGKNAANNDLLTFRYAHKNDLWMHARDVSGSHVIIKNQSGTTITNATIEKVASIAAYYSKSKNQTLAVVQYTLKKFVVKGKGRNPGEVNLLNEQTVMVKPNQPE